jgi:membrane protease YdiL (CAAX protease family)
MKILAALTSAFRGSQRKATLILLITTPLLLLWKYYARPEAFASFGQVAEWQPETVGSVGHFLSCFLLLGIVPASIIVLIFHERLQDYGLGIGIPRRTLALSVLGAPLFVIAAYLGSENAEIAAVFPINPHAGQSPGMFALHAATYLLFYIGWETFFRGFLLFGLRDSLGDVNAVLIQVLASSLLHIGSPASETFGAIIAGIAWAMCALYSRSILPSLIQHSTLGIFLDAFLSFGDG